MVLTKRAAGWLGALGLTAFTVLPLIGCGSDRMASPAAPSSAQAPVASLSASMKTASATTASGDRTTTPATTTTTHDETRDGRNEPVEGEGTVTSLRAGTSCPALEFVLSDRHLIKTTSSTAYEGGACADIKVGTRVHVKGELNADGSVTASRVSVRAPEHRTPEPVEGEGVVSSVRTGTSCPTLEFMLERVVIKVDGSTAYEGGACADITVGTRVHVKGALNADGSVTASRVSVQSRHEPERVEGEGTVTSLRAGTACPALEFVLSDRHVIKTTSSTTYDGGACADIKVGTRLHVKGAINADGSVTASSVNIQGRDTHEDAEGDGGVTSLVTGTACPALTFVIEEYTIAVSSSTEYVGGTCADIKVGTKLGVKGSKTAEKNVTATRITFRH